MKPKEWLLANGHIKEITRGRMSRENIALIEDAVKAGTKIEGYAVASAPKDGPVKDEAKVEKVKADPNRILDIPENPFRDENQWEAYANVDGKIVPIGMRTVDNGCGNSLTYCACRTAVVWVDADVSAVVNFKPRTTPLSNKRW